MQVFVEDVTGLTFLRKLFFLVSSSIQEDFAFQEKKKLMVKFIYILYENLFLDKMIDVTVLTNC